ncbi:uncharacterized protein LOC130976782 [Arachis stenosperma]|uniref:uncharacterized protein LOC130976782 n=1 Tax=Arachis stenosperma TaxID=217475 RepID=UPI0025AB865F|nr:uncharacterized protein LOC130976782 [Arachis stenosperma]
MGNCCMVESSVEWAGDDWGSLTTSRHGNLHNSKKNNKVLDEEQDGGLGNVEKEKLLIGALRASSDENGKVKIMISKKELKKLLRAPSSSQHQGSSSSSSSSSAEQVLARLIYARDHYDQHDLHHRHWRPALQSIPEN